MPLSKKQGLAAFGMGVFGKVANYSALPNPTTVADQTWIALAAQGTQWLPGSLGGTYYPSGQYFSDGTNWIYDATPYQASQSSVNAGIITDQFVSPATLYNSTQWATKENVANKATGFGTLNNTLYPTTQAVANYVAAFGYGTVSTVSVVTNQGVSGSVANASTTPAITLSLGALIGVTSFNGLIVTANTGVITTGAWNGSSISTTYTDAKIKGSTTSGGALFASATDTASTDTAFLWDNTNKRLQVGTATITNYLNSNISSSANAFSGLSITNTNSAAFGSAIYFNNDTNLGGILYFPGTAKSGNWTGTSVPYANKFFMQSGANGAYDYVNAATNIWNLIGTTSTNYATKLDATGLRIDTMANIHTANSYAFAVGTNLTWDNTNNRLNVGTATPSVTQDINLAKSNNGAVAIGVTNTSSGVSALTGFAAYNNLNNSVFSLIYSSGYSGNYSGTSIPFAGLAQFGTGSGANPFMISGTPIYNIIGTTTTNLGTRLDATGLRIGAISGLHTANTVRFEITANGATGDVGLITNTTTTGYSYLKWFEDSTHAFMIGRHNSAVAGNFAGTSLPFANSAGFWSGITSSNNMTLAFFGTPITFGTGIASTNVGLRTSTKGFHLTTLANLHSDNVGSGDLVFYIQNATTVPSTNPTGGGILYAEAGALKWRGSSGTITTLAPA